MRIILSAIAVGTVFAMALSLLVFQGVIRGPDRFPCDGLKQASFFVGQVSNAAGKSFGAFAVDRRIEDARRQIGAGDIRMFLVFPVQH